MMTQQLFTDLGVQLLQYKNANVLQRQALLHEAKEKVAKLNPQVTSKESAIENYTTLAYSESLVNYADVLRRMENQDYFDILIDFYKMPMQGDFVELNQFFEFGPIPGQMRLKCPISEIKPNTWELFRKAQKAHLKAVNKEHLFDLDQLDINNLAKDNYYPIPIQMCGKLLNEAVDRICVNSEGQYRFAKRFGKYLLPGGGMVEISDIAGTDARKRKMLEEHVEEEQANIYLNAAELFNVKTYTRQDFFGVITNVLASNSAQTIGSENIAELYKILSTSITENSATLATIINKIDTFIALEKAVKNSVRLEVGALEAEIKSLKEKGSDISIMEVSLKRAKEMQLTAQIKLKSLAELRAQVQVRTFERTSLFAEAFQHIQDNTIMIDILQYLDTRGLSSTTLSHSFVMTGQPLEDWFKAKFNGKEGAFGDDIAGSEIERLTLPEVFAKFRDIKFSHMLIALANQIICLNNGTLKLEKAWNPEQFSKACDVFKTEVTKVVDANAVVLSKAAANSAVNIGIFANDGTNQVVTSNSSGLTNTTNFK